jgi:hypothetical protein
MDPKLRLRVKAAGLRAKRGLKAYCSLNFR